MRHSIRANAIRLGIAVVAVASLAAAGEAIARADGVAGNGDDALFSRAAWTPAGQIKRSVLDLALGAASCAVRSGAVASPSTLTVIDYSLPSTERRLWVFDVPTRRLLYEELVAHGSGSGENMATSFSNTPESRQSSLGLFVTERPYVGRNGYSLRLDGLDRGFNDLARARAIVIHGAAYVSEAAAKSQGRLGRSWGCPAVREGVARELIDRVTGGGLVFAYYPDPAWLSRSAFVRCAAAAGAAIP